MAAARTCFSDDGYDRVSLRAIAARAGVDPALVHHYFAGGKPELFGVVMQDDLDPGVILDRVIGDHAIPAPEAFAAAATKGAVIVTNFVRLWDSSSQAENPSRFISFIQAASSSPEAARAVRDFLAERIWSHLSDNGRSADELIMRRALIASQLMGVAIGRYVLGLEPVASATPEELGAWVGPTIDRYSDGDLG